MTFLKSKYVLITLGGTLLFIGVFAGLQSVGLKGVPSLFPGLSPPPEPAPAANDPAAAETDSSPSVLFLKIAGDANTLIVRWRNLPADASLLNIFRSRRGEDAWQLWKTIAVASPSGEESISLAPSDAGDFLYYAGAVGAGAQGAETSVALWTSTPAAPSPAPELPRETEALPVSSSSSNTASSSESASTTNQQYQPQTPAPTTTQPIGGAGAQPTSQESTSTIYYYTPQVQVSGTSTANAAEFWVHHTDQRIEIGWQNLPMSTTEIIVLRAPQESGAWVAVLTQQSPDPVGPFKIKLNDETLHSDRYYKLEARDGSALITTFGPIFLPGL